MFAKGVKPVSNEQIARLLMVEYRTGRHPCFTLGRVIVMTGGIENDVDIHTVLNVMKEVNRDEFISGVDFQRQLDMERV